MSTKSMEKRPILVTRREGILRVQLNNPRGFNALNEAMVTSLAEALDSALTDPPDLLLLTGSKRFFCFGVDFKRMGSLPPDQAVARLLPDYQKIIGKIATFPSPTLAVLNGHAAGAGLDLALAADFRIAKEGIKLTEAFIKWGLVPDGGGTWNLPRMVGLQQAKRLALLGEPVTAREALAIGLVDDVISAEELQDAERWWCEKLMALPRKTYVATRRLLHQHADISLEAALAGEREEQVRRCRDEEFLSRTREVRTNRER